MPKQPEVKFTAPSFQQEVPVRLEDAARSPKPMPGTPDGREVVSSVPMAPPIGWKKQPSMIDHIRNLVRSERLRQEVEAAGFETPEEADDFDIGDDYDPQSPYEHNFDPPAPAVAPAGVVGGGAGGAEGSPSPPPASGPPAAQPAPVTPAASPAPSATPPTPSQQR